MRALPVLAACLLAGCVLPSEPAPADAPPTLDVLGDVAVREATLMPATYGQGVPAPPLRVLMEGGAAEAGEGQAVSLRLAEGGARLRLLNHGEWVRTSLRWEDPGCVVTLRTPTVDSTMPGGRVSLDNAIAPDHPYHDYRFTGTCEGRLFILWRG